MQTLFGFELSIGLRWIIAFAIVLVLVALFAFLLRKITGGRLRLKGQGGGRARQPRLGVVDIHDLDRQRQLILIRRDNVEHLVMIGGASDVVVETNILRSGGRIAPSSQAELPSAERPLAFDPLLAAEPGRTDALDEPRRAAPPPPPAPALAAEMLPPLPPRAPSPPPQQQPRPASAAPAPAPVSTPSAPAPAAQPAPPPPNFARDRPPAASSGELDDMARQLEEALKRPFQAVRPPQTPPEPPKPPEPANPAPSQPMRAPTPAAPPKPEFKLPPPPPPAPAPLAPPPVSGRPIATPADVEAELELALGLKPGPSLPKPPVPAPTPTSPPPAAFVPPPKPFLPPRPETAPEPKLDKPAAAQREDAPIRRESERDDPATDKPPATEAKSAPMPEPKSEPKPDPMPEVKPEPKPTPIDPFSVDAIEAEFARLLGRDPKTKP